MSTKLFSYPQGDVSFLPTIFALAAVVSNLFMFPDPPFLDNVPGDGNFMCFQYRYWYPSTSSYTGSYDSSGSSYEDSSGSDGYRQLVSKTDGYECGQLRIANKDYWTDNDTDAKYVPFQVASLLAVFALTTGIFSLALQLSAACFELSPNKLRTIMILHIVCTVLNFLTIPVAAVTPICEYVKDEAGDNVKCERHHFTGIRLEEGAICAIFATFFYIMASITVAGYRKRVIAAYTTYEEHETVQVKHVPEPVEEYLETGSYEVEEVEENDGAYGAEEM